MAAVAGVSVNLEAVAAAKPLNRGWGLHCDFHAEPVMKDGQVVSNDEQIVVGATLKESDVAEICDVLKPDFLQIDCKGHPGWTSYPSKLGNAMPKFKGDPLKLWRKVTQAKGVPLYMHYSGIWDTLYAERHPEDALVEADGKRSKSLKADGPYADRLVIPQLCELAGDYGVDGVWIDGDCWAAGCDYEEAAVRKFEQTTGIELKGRAPKSVDDPYFHDFCDYYRELYREYVRHVVDAVHERHPDFRIASNWSYSSNRPEAVDSNVDFVSGDLASVDSVRSGRTAARINACSGLPWDLMAWGFVFDWKPGSRHIPKTPVELMQEAAAVISLGGGFQVYICQKRDGSPDMPRIRELKPVGEFVRERLPFCLGGRMKKEVAVLLSARNQYRETGGALFNCGGQFKTTGVMNLLADYGRSVGIALDADLEPGRLGRWPVLIVPELFDTLPDAVFKSIEDWVKQGGMLVVTGGHACDVFAQAGFPTALNDDLVPNERGFTMDGGKTVGGLQWSRTLRDRDGEILATTEKNEPFAAVRAFGKGRVAVCGADFGSSYENTAQCRQAELMLAMLDRLYTPVARVTRVTGSVETSVLEKDGKLFVQLVNANGDHSNPRAYTEATIPPVMDLKLDVGRVDLHDILEIR